MHCGQPYCLPILRCAIRLRSGKTAPAWVLPSLRFGHAETPGSGRMSGIAESTNFGAANSVQLSKTIPWSRSNCAAALSTRRGQASHAQTRGYPGHWHARFSRSKCTAADTTFGDCYLLCCDGLTDLVPHQQIQQLIGNGEDLETSCRALVDAANEAGGEDNITVILVRVSE